ncbi:transcriptional regulator, TetR family [Jatrophihabitans endophyticus]|uniref:Transcriptional regulator, TetR family n=1 Tax=Jatrophihabitans endophyticus TaxID=1206085 RepID=A0A1M5IVP1_9ACTN|nr:TetR/AcrR family transcriptional regulator [Jatrophihabitans endophyticus]SHG32040.1 transcriptional regulator, TetR family [Jatrophihabitans endophyticus]
MGHREQLLAAARRLIEERGYARITARDLVAASDTNLGSIGYHFGSKAGLLNEAIELAFRDYAEQIAGQAMAGTTATPLERAAATWTTAIDNFADQQPVLQAYVEALAQAMRVPELRAQLAGHYARARSRVAELVAVALADGSSADEPHCRAVAAVVIATCDGLAMQWLLDPEGVPSSDEVGAGLAAVLAASYRPPETSRTAGRTSAR